VHSSFIGASCTDGLGRTRLLLTAHGRHYSNIQPQSTIHRVYILSCEVRICTEVANRWMYNLHSAGSNFCLPWDEATVRERAVSKMIMDLTDRGENDERAPEDRGGRWSFVRGNKRTLECRRGGSETSRRVSVDREFLYMSTRYEREPKPGYV